MAVPRSVRTTVLLAASAIGPFAAIWTLTAAAGWAHRRPNPVQSVSLFSDYFDQQPPLATAALPPGRQIWTDSSSSPAPFFQDVAVVGGDVVVAGRTRLYVIRPDTGEVRSEVLLPPKLQGVSSLGALPGRLLSTYSFDSGLFSVVDPGARAVRNTMRIDKGIGEAYLLSNRIVGNGGLPNALLRTYAVMPSSVDEPAQLALAQQGGAPLFPRLTRTFSRQLNVTSMAASPTGDRIVLAFRWSDRINIHDARTLRLERSIAGPSETRLSFGVVRHEDETIFTLDPETTHSYADVVALGNAVVAAYSGLEMRRHGSAMGLASAIHVFSWDGRLIGEWSLPEPVQKLAIDADTQTLYALKIRPAALVAIDARAVVKAISTFVDSER